MKTKMKFIAAIGIMMGFAVSANAQNSVSQPVVANASVQTKLVLTQVQPLEFGTVDNVVAQSKTISVDGVATASGLNQAPGQTGVQEGVAQIVRTGNSSITYKLSNTPTNLAGDNSSLLPIGSYVTSFSYVLDVDKSAGNPTVGSDTEVNGTGNNIFVYIGATVTPSSATTSIGLHTASITLSAEYN